MARFTVRYENTRESREALAKAMEEAAQALREGMIDIVAVPEIMSVEEEDQ